MRRLRSTRRLLLVGLPLALLLAGTAAVGLARGRSEVLSAPVPPIADDERLEAVEDIALLEAYVKAKEAQVRQGDQRVKILKTYRDDSKTRQAKGYANALQVADRELQLLEGETDRAFRAAELKDFEVRLARARRRLAQLPPAE